MIMSGGIRVGWRSWWRGFEGAEAAGFHAKGAKVSRRARKGIIRKGSNGMIAKIYLIKNISAYHDLEYLCILCEIKTPRALRGNSAGFA